MAISRAQMGKQIRNGSVTRSNRKVLTLPPGVRRTPRTLTKLMRQARRDS